jgi:taurine--2-oxoglutarate transaminase
MRAAATLRRARRLSSTTLNALDVPDRSLTNPLPQLDTRCGAPTRDHWAGTWSKAQIDNAAQKHVMFTYGPTDAQRDAVPLLRRGAGSYLYDDEGKAFLDWTSQAVCANLGHTVPASVKEAIMTQLDTLPYVYGGLGLVEPRARLAALLGELLPADLNGFLFPSSGAEANEAAIRIARQYTGRSKVLTRYRSYHGGTANSLAATGDFRRNFVSETPGFVKLMDPNPTQFSWGDSMAEASERARGALREQVLAEGPETIAAIMVEAIPGSAGVLLPPDGYVQAVRSICDEFGIVLIVDEVMAGFGRTGKMFGFQHFDDVVPDVVTFAKGLTGSYLPLAGVAMRSHLQDHFRSHSLGYGATYQAHPVSLACGYAVLKHMLDEDIVGTVKNVTAPILKEEMQSLVEDFDCIRQARSVGLFACADLVESATNQRVSGMQGGGPNTTKIVEFKQALRAEGLIAFFRNCMIHVCPPLTIAPDELRDGFGKLRRTLRAVDF